MNLFVETKLNNFVIIEVVQKAAQPKAQYG